GVQTCALPISSAPGDIMTTTPRNVLPKGVSASDFEQALAQIRTIVGADYVVAEDTALAPYNKIMMAVPDEQHAPSAAVMPDSVEQIQAIMKVLNQHRIPVYPISTGRNLGYGSAAPVERGQLVKDLRCMDRILDVDADLCTALVGPGVTYHE